MLKRIVTAAVAAVLALAASAPAVYAQKALVYCPVGIDATGCDRIVTALQPTFGDGVDRGYDGTNGTVDLSKIDLHHYGVFVVPSLADDATKQPYALLRSVASRLHFAITGRVAVYSGAPDQGNSNRSDKDALIQNLATWAANGHSHATGLVGLVAFLDLSEHTSDRYSWVRDISLTDVSADAQLTAFGDVQAVSPRGTSVLSAGGRSVRFSNMASYGLHIGRRAAARTEVGALGGSSGAQSVLVMYSNADGKDGATTGGSAGTGKVGASSASLNITGAGATLGAASTTSSSTSTATASAPTITTDKPDYLPGDTVTFTGTGFAAGDTVTITVHEDPTWNYPDRQFVAVADANGAFTNRDMIVQQLDLGVTFTATAVAVPSGFVAQTTFTDGKESVQLATVDNAAPTTVTWRVTWLAYQNSSGCSGTIAVNGTTTLTGNTVDAGSQAPTANGNQSLLITDAVATGTSASQYTFNYWSLAPDGTSPYTPICESGTSGNAPISPTLYAHFKPAAAATSTAVSSSLNPSKYGQSVTFTATVTRASGSGSPTGTIQFKVDGANLGSPVALSSVDATSASASSDATSTLSVTTGTNHVVSAEYSAGSGFVSSTGTLSGGQEVDKADQVISWADPAPITYGTTLATVLTATVTTGDGALTYTEGATVLSTSDVLGAGPHTLTATAAATANYNSATKSVSLTVNKASPAFSNLSAPAITYDPAGTSATVTGTLKAGTLIPPGSVSVSIAGTGGALTGSGSVDGSGNFSITVTGGALPANATGYDVTVSYTGTANFSDASDNSLKLVVNKKLVSLSATVGTLTYTGNSQGPSFAGDVALVTVSYSGSGGTTYGPSTVQPTNAGSYTWTAALNDANNYQFAPAATTTGSFAIGKANQNALSITGVPATVTFGDAKFTLGTSGGSGNGALTWSTSSTACSVNATTGEVTIVSAGSCDISVTKAGGTNYFDATASTTFAVEKKAVNLSASVGSLTYTGDPQGPAFTGDLAQVDIKFSGVSPTSYGPSATLPTNAGNYSWSATLNDATDYKFADGVTTVGTFGIAKADATINVQGYTCVYDGNAHGASGTAKGVKGESLSGLDLGASFTDVPGGTATWTFTDATGNYNNRNGSVSIAISKATAVISVTAYSVNYDGHSHTASGTATGVANTNLSGQLTLSGTTHTSAGTYNGDAWSFAGGTNYENAIGTVNDEIKKVQLTVTAPSYTVTYGDPVPTPIAPNITGFVTGEGTSALTTQPTCTTTYTPTSNASSAQTTSCGGGTAANYSFTYVSGTVTVNRKAATVTAQDQTKAYGDAFTFSGTEFTPGGLINGDVVSSVTLSSAGTPAAASPLNSPYAITASNAVGTGLGNYSINYVGGKLFVTNNAPVITSAAGPSAPVAAGSQVTVTGTFTDHGIANDAYTVSSSWASTGSPLSFAGTSTFDGNAGTFTIQSASVPVGVYTVTITVTDKWNAASAPWIVTAYVVVYDPNGGFVTGGGWISANNGSCVQQFAPSGVCSNATGGRANFGFVSKYQKGANVPSGNTEFQFQDGNLNFKSTNYQWLVISGPQAQFKGTGTINGGSAVYSFILTAWDGQASGGGGTDKFRIKIMDANGNVVFDNQLGDSDSAAPTTGLGGGSIQIQSK